MCTIHRVVVTSTVALCCLLSRATANPTITEPAWIKTHHSTHTTYIGVGSSKTGTAAALKEAKQEILRQINESILSDIKKFAPTTAKNLQILQPEAYTNLEHPFCSSLIERMSEKDRWEGPHGQHWSRVTLDKSAYQSIVHGIITDAINTGMDALNITRSARPSVAIQELFKALQILRSLGDIQMQVTFDGRTENLSRKLHQSLQGTLSAMSLRPNAKNVRMPLGQVYPDSLGAYILINNEIDNTMNIIWKSSNALVGIHGLPPRVNGLRPLVIDSFPSTVLTTTITATADLNPITSALSQHGFNLPTATITLGRPCPTVLVSDTSAFCKIVLSRLSETNTLSQVENRPEADFILSLKLVPISSRQANSTGDYHRAASELTISLKAPSGRRIIDFSGIVTNGGEKSPKQIEQLVFNQAVDIAINRIKSAF